MALRCGIHQVADQLIVMANCVAEQIRIGRFEVRWGVFHVYHLSRMKPHACKWTTSA